MSISKKISLPLCVGLVGLSETSSAITVVVKMQASSVAPPSNIFVTTNIPNGSARVSSVAPPANIFATGYVTPDAPGTPVASDVSGTPRTSRSDASPAASQGSSGRSEGRNRASAPSSPQRPAAAASATDYSGSAKSAKGGEVPQITFEDPGAFRFSAEAGYASKHLWRGIDLAQFTSTNYAPGGAPEADSDVTFIGANATYKGFAFGLKYIETIDDTFNPFFARFTDDLDSYQEFVISVNYTRMLVGSDILQGTAGFDFYYYPNGEFWGVDNQGMLYARFSSPHYKWAQPFLEVFYNVAIDSDGNGLAASDALSIRNATGSDLVEGGGGEIGVNGGDSVYSNGAISVGLTYSLSTFYKTGYQFEDDGFSHVGLTLGAPVSIGSNLTITPSVSYIEALGDIEDNLDPKAGTNFGGNAAAAWNEPGWVASVKASWQF